MNILMNAILYIPRTPSVRFVVYLFCGVLLYNKLSRLEQIEPLEFEHRATSVHLT